MITPALHKIASDVEHIASELDAGHTVEAFELRILATRLCAQAEILEIGRAHV